MSLSFGSFAGAAVPTRLEYQGYLTDVVGTPIDCQGCLTPYTFQFSLYDSVVGGEVIWTEAHSGVDIVHGMFRVELGTEATLQAELLDGNRWLEIQINEQDPLVPRQRVVSAPFALRADLAERALESENAVALGGHSVDSFVQVADTVDFVSGSELNETLVGLGYSPGDNDSLAGLDCAQDQIIKWNGTAWACASDADINTQLTEAEVDAYVANNGYAGQTHLSAVQAALDTLHILVNNLDTDTDAEISALQTLISNLDTSTAAEISALQTLISNLDTSTDAEISALQTQITALDESLDPIAKTGLPSSMIAFFPDSCPDGWTPYTGAEGRIIVGLAVGGTKEGTVGTALADLGTRTIQDVAAHQHSGAAHTHEGAAHSHSAPSHTHPFSGTTNINGDHSHSAGASVRLVGSGCCESGLSVTSTGVSGNHPHSFSGTTAEAEGGTTSVTTPDATGSTVPGPGGNTGVTSVDVTMPYVQLLACQKD